MRTPTDLLATAHRVLLDVGDDGLAAWFTGRYGGRREP